MNKMLACAALAIVLFGMNEARAGDVCDQIREAAERTATTTAERLRIFREYNECKRNLEEMRQGG